jgi:hypothetical protein
MSLFGLHAPTFGPLHPIIGKLAGTSLSGFTSTRIPFAAADGSLTDSANLTWDGTTLDVHGYNCSAGIFRTNNYQNSAGNRSIIYSTGDDEWYVSYNFNIAGTLNVNGATTLGNTLEVTGVTTVLDTVLFTSSTEYIDQEDW